MKSVSNRKSELIKLFKTLQACKAETIDPAKYTILGNVILGLDVPAATALRKEAAKVVSCREGQAFTAQEIEQLLAEAAAISVDPKKSDQQNAVSSHDAFVRQLGQRVRRFLVPFVTPGLRVKNVPSSMQRFAVGPCEFSSDPKRIRAIFRQIGVTIDFRAKQRHAFPEAGRLKLPSNATIAVVDVTSSSRYAPVQAQAALEEAYGLIALLLDAVATEGPGGPNTRMPLLSWQFSPPLAPICRIATEPATMAARLRTGTGFDQLWHNGYDIDLSAVETRLRNIGFFDRERELFSATTDMAARIRTALRWLTRAFQARGPETQFLNFAIVLESLFTAPASEYKISALIRDCVEKISTWNDPTAVRQLVSKLYGQRSGIVHQGVIPKFMRELDELHGIVVQCLGELLMAGDHLKSYDDMLSRLSIKLEDYRQETIQTTTTGSAST